MTKGIAFRSRIISSGGCGFRVRITADYGQEVREFTLDCDSDGEGNVSFCVVEPDSIADITGVINGDEGTVTYDGLQLAFPLFVNDQISPVSASGLVLDCWLNEYILSAGMTDQIYRVTYEKKIQEKALLIDTYFEKDIPISAELCYNGYRIMNLMISEFSFH